MATSVGCFLWWHDFTNLKIHRYHGTQVITTTPPATHNYLSEPLHHSNKFITPLTRGSSHFTEQIARTHANKLQILFSRYLHSHLHTVVIPLLISIPLAVQSSPGWSSGEWRQAEPVRSAYYHRLAANLQGQTQLHFPSNASAELD